MNDKNTYARRILAWLYRRTIIKENGYASFPELIKGVLQPPDLVEKADLRKDIYDLAKVLVALDEFRFSDTTSREKKEFEETKPNKWCQLIIIKFNDSNYKNSTVLAEKLWDEYNAKTSSESSNENNYGIKITNAGAFFAYIQCDFEYFACRYDKSNTPLLLMRDCDTIKRTIACVYGRAKKCIDYVIKKEHEFSKGDFRVLDDKNYPSNDGKSGLSYPYRMIKNHRYYLSQYKKIIEQEKNKHLDLSDDEHEKLKRFINKYIKNYKRIFVMLKKNKYEIAGVKGPIKDYFNTIESSL